MPFWGQTFYFSSKFEAQSEKFQILRFEKFLLFQLRWPLDGTIDFFLLGLLNFYIFDITKLWSPESKIDP